MLKATATVVLITATTAFIAPIQGQAFSLKGLAEQALGNGESKETQPSTNTPATLDDMLNQGIDSVAGEGTAAIINGDISPEVALAANQLGIPNEYLPQLQSLYDSYKGNGAVSAADVQSQKGLSGWLAQKDGLSATGLASGLSTIFGGDE